MLEISQLAQAAINELSPILHDVAPLASKAAGAFASQAGGKLFSWLSDQVKGQPAAAILDRAVEEPENRRRLDALRLEIEEMAERDEAFRKDLTELLRASGSSQRTTTAQTASTTGDGNKGVQNIGSTNSIHIR